MAPNALDGYELIDFGEGRKLEQWGDILLDRPSPAAEGVRRQEPKRWQDADGRYERFGGDSGTWSWRRKPPESWQVQWKELCFLLAPTPFGHVGLFPEQQGNWDWLARQSTKAAPLKVLNLFAYSGASTLAVSAEQNEVVHVDASKSSVNKARQNASASGLEKRTLRWIVEDVQRFCEREVRRGNQYDAFVIDPPAFGHGPKGERWDLEQHLAALI